MGSFEEFYLDEKTSDVTFSVGQRKFVAHKFLLFTRSDVFKSMFFTDNKDGKQKDIIIENTTEEAFEVMLKYCYTDKFDIDCVDNDFDCTIDVYNLAQRFQIQGLMNSCVVALRSILKRVIDTINSDFTDLRQQNTSLLTEYSLLKHDNNLLKNDYEELVHMNDELYEKYLELYSLVPKKLRPNKYIPYN